MMTRMTTLRRLQAALRLFLTHYLLRSTALHTASLRKALVWRFGAPSALMACVLALLMLGSSLPSEAAWRSYKRSSKSSSKSFSKSSSRSSRSASKHKSSRSESKYSTSRYSKYSKGKKGKRYAHARRSGRRSYRRHACNTSTGKTQAYVLLQSNQALAQLSSLEYRADPNAAKTYIANDLGEIDEDEDYDDSELEDAAVSDARFGADPSKLYKLWLEYMPTVDTNERAAMYADEFIAGMVEKRELMQQILGWIGTPYWYGGTQRNGVDCSAFTRAIYRMAGEIELPRTAAMQSSVGEHIRNSNDLRFGDLIFFNTRPSVYVSHVGVYLGDNLFAHASSRYGVTVSSLEGEYYQQRYLGGKRLRSEDIRALSTSRAVTSLVNPGSSSNAASSRRSSD
jgi:hypothetical protein